VRENGTIVETRIATDIFVPMIRGLDFTEGSSFGEVVQIG